MRDTRAGSYELGGTPFTLAELAAEISRLSGRDVRYTNLPEDAYAKALAGAGLPAGAAAVLADTDRAAAQGALYVEGDDLPRLLGRPSRRSPTSWRPRCPASRDWSGAGRSGPTACRPAAARPRTRPDRAVHRGRMRRSRGPATWKRQCVAGWPQPASRADRCDATHGWMVLAWLDTPRTGPRALMTFRKARGGLDCDHRPFALRAIPPLPGWCRSPGH